MNSKRSLVFSLLLVVALAITACGGITQTPTPEPTKAPEPTQPPASVEEPTATTAPTLPEPTPTLAPVTITLWHGWEGSILDNYTAIFKKYEADHPNVTIQLEYIPDLSDKIVTAVPAGEGPDIVAAANDWIGRLAEAEIIIPLDDYIDRSAFEAAFAAPAVASQVYQDKVWGFPESMEALTLIYNKAKITADELPKTTAELLENAAQWKTDHPGEYYLVYDAKTNAYFSAPWFYGNGAFFVKEDGSVGLDTPGGAAAAAFLQNLHKVMPDDIDYSVADTLFKEGKAPITINGPWYLADLDTLGMDYGLAMLPDIAEGQPAVPFVGVRTLMVTSNSQNPETAVDIIRYFTNDDSQKTLTQANKSVPSSLAAGADPQTQALESVAMISRQAANGTPMPNSPYMSALWDPVGKLLQALWAGTDPAEALKSAQEAAETNIAGMK